MPSFVVLANFTDEGAKGVSEGTARREAAKERISAAGGRMIFWYLTMGEYDFVAVVEVPDAETIAKIAMSIGSQGEVRTKTMRAFTEEEADALISSLG